MPKTVTFKVTREDLKGYYSDSQDCPIALAAKRYFKKPVWVTAWYLSIPVWGMRYKLNRSASSKAYARGNNSLWGKLMGGFAVVLTELPE